VHGTVKPILVAVRIIGNFLNAGKCE